MLPDDIQIRLEIKQDLHVHGPAVLTSQDSRRKTARLRGIYRVPLLLNRQDYSTLL